MPTFEFDGYKLRPALEADLGLARAWNEADPDHAWEMGQERYWIEQSGSVNSMVLMDAFGEAVFFFKAVRDKGSLEISIQFNRVDAVAPLWRTMCGMSAGMRWLERILPGNGIRRIYFGSKSERLIRFAIRRLGFEEVENFGESLAMGFRRFAREIE